jgi:DNA-binding transcriptional regulator YiaG
VLGARKVRKPRHAARTYSCTTPPRRSRRRIRASPSLRVRPKRAAIARCGSDKSGGNQPRFLSPAPDDSRQTFRCPHCRPEGARVDEERQATLLKNLDRIRKKLNPARRKKVATRAAALISQERTLQELRHAHKLTQKRMAEVLGIGQDSVSRIEQRSDLLISTLRGYVEAMGGRIVPGRRVSKSRPGHPGRACNDGVGLDRWVTRLPIECRLNVVVTCSATMAGFSERDRDRSDS